ncbi:MAG: YfiR family protein [Geobacteraceae bacterium]|nr:YfiR family protein [Geobacteraceae bacterium]
MLRKLQFISVLLLLWLSLENRTCTAETPQEFKVKAGYILNIPKFADWPSSATGYPSFKVCVIGDTPIYDVLETLKGQRIKSHPVAILKVQEITQADSCHVLFIAASERYRLQRLLPEAHRLGIMTISDMRNFSKQGGMVSLVSVNSRITYDLNLVSARSAAISFSSQILKLANDVIN